MELGKPISPSYVLPPPQPYDETGECPMGDMDGETGEWFPPACERKEEQVDAPRSDSDSDSSSDNDEFSERRSKAVAREFLAESLNGDVDDDEPCTSDCPVRNNPNLSSCSLLLKPSIPASFHMINEDEEPVPVSNGNAMLSETGEPMYHCNGRTENNVMANGNLKLANCTLAT